ncbi:hypothetical protein ACFYZ9_02975 [Streptomyces sp. NPDC001691]|uniref:hypothetical protein n=1 Tax=unclassified Streptomyces TaxID=2593676 RepID=UPI000DE944FF|nr:hypothetical protein [Streptomyces sp. SDr-06]RCH65431.1 hypothetical protein DT019_28625 [Streptomyces sp. SDr-06]
MGISTRAGLASVMACMATAAAVAPAAAAPAVPVVVPLGALNTVLPFEAPTLSTGMPLPVPGVPDGPRYVKGNLMPKNMVPAVPIESAVPDTHLGAPLPDPLSSRVLGTPALISPDSALHVVTPGADLGAPLSQPRAALFGLPAVTLPKAGLTAPAVQGAPAATASF